MMHPLATPKTRGPFSVRRLQPFDSVLITPQDRRATMRKLACHVLGVTGSRVHLEPVDARELGTLGPAAPDVFLSFLEKGGLVALKGTLMVRRMPGGADVAPELSFTASERVKFASDADFGVPMCTPVTLSVGGDVHHTQSVHVSHTGVLVEDAPGAGTAVEIEIALPGSTRPVEASGVVGAAGDDGTAVTFTQIVGVDHRRLEKVVVDGHREALRNYKRWRKLEPLD